MALNNQLHGIVTRQLSEARKAANVGIQEVCPHVKGHVKIELLYPNGKCETVLNEKNLVVRIAEEVMAMMSLGLRQFSYIELGDAVSPSTPTLDDITLQQSTGLRKSVSGTASGNSVILIAEWSTAEANGVNISEAGVFSTPFGSGLMFARKVFSPPIVKTASFGIRITWGYVFNVDENASGCSGVALIGGSTVTQEHIFESSSGGELQVTVPIDFVVGSKQLDVFMNGVRLTYGRQYFESMIGAAKGVVFIGFAALPGDIFYFVRRTLA